MPGTATPVMMSISKLTPILYVEAIEPSLRFWCDQLGFTIQTSVPHEDKLGFVILQQPGIEVMMQTRASVAADVPALANTPRGSSFLFLEVESIDAIQSLVPDAPVLVPRRQTFYGADEFFVREPGGNIVGFAAFPARDPAAKSA